MTALSRELRAEMFQREPNRHHIKTRYELTETDDATVYVAGFPAQMDNSASGTQSGVTQKPTVWMEVMRVIALVCRAFRRNDFATVMPIALSGRMKWDALDVTNFPSRASATLRNMMLRTSPGRCVSQLLKSATGLTTA